MSFSSDGFWQSVLAYEPPLCASCGDGVAVTEDGSCSACHWEIQTEIDECWPAFGSYLGNWAAFRDWESS